MLKRFAVKNFRTFNEQLVFDLTTDKRYGFNDNAVAGNIIQHAMIYGGNGSGKSNLGLAFGDIYSHFVSSNPHFEPDNAAYLNGDSDEALAQFEYLFDFNGAEVKYHYGKNEHKSIVYEMLWINSELVIAFDNRDSDLATIELEGTESLDRKIGHNIKSALTYVFNNSNLAKTTANQAFVALFDFVDKMAGVIAVSQWLHRALNQEAADFEIRKYILDAPEGAKRLQQFLNDLNIDCTLKVIEQLGRKRLAFVYKNRALDFFSSASNGTVALAHLFCAIEELDAGKLSFLYFDEFDAYYHQKLAKAIAKRISNTNCQTIISTHNTGIMSNDILRPDCYFELADGKITPLHKLTDRELRKAHNLEKMYRAGAFDE